MKRAVFTTTTTLPPSISRDAVLKTLHNHPEMIELNPLVIHYSRCEPNPSAPAEERDSDWTWYELKDRISFLPGGLLRGNSPRAAHPCVCADGAGYSDYMECWRE